MWNWSAFTSLAVVAMVVLMSAQATDAKRGCATFGHSCYGGMGKRSGESINLNVNDVLDEVQQQEEDNPEDVFTGPRSDYGNRHAISERQRQLTAQDIYSLSPFIRQWLRSIRNDQGLPNLNMD
ncbi:hypothetical protein Trydic_g8983 [Trypoxylus dichotomus]